MTAKVGTFLRSSDAAVLLDWTLLCISLVTLIVVIVLTTTGALSNAGGAPDVMPPPGMTAQNGG